MFGDDKTVMPDSYEFIPRTPFHMVWIATNQCNARCSHCSSNSSHKTSDELTTEEAIKMVDKLSSSGTVDLAISGGEPLLRKDIFEIIAHAKSHGLSVGIGSNGATLSERKLHALLETRIDRVQISIDGPAHAHDSLRKWDGLYKRALRTVRILVESGIRTHVCTTINRKNWEMLEDFTSEIATTGISRLNFSRYVPVGRGTDEFDLTINEWRHVINLSQKLKEKFSGTLDIVSHLAQQILVDSTCSTIPAFNGCQAGIGQGAITANGTIQPCVLLPVPIGNIRSSDFCDVWRNSPIIHALHDRANLQGKCGNCAFRRHCGGCRAVALSKTGNYLASDPRCWLQ